MGDFKVKKRVSLEFLGKDHEDDFLSFAAIPVDEYKTIANKQPEDNIEAIDYIVKQLKDRFIEGSFQKQEVANSDLGKFPAEVVTECFLYITGQKIDPKY